MALDQEPNYTITMDAQLFHYVGAPIKWVDCTGSPINEPWLTINADGKFCVSENAPADKLFELRAAIDRVLWQQAKQG